MEEKFIQTCNRLREEALGLGVRIRPMESMEQVHRVLSGHRQSDGFAQLAKLNRLDLTVEALAVKKQFTALFSDEEANNALMRLIDAGYDFK